MSLPLLTPSDTAIFDDLVLEQMDLPDEIVCGYNDEAAAVWVQMRCCPKDAFLCSGHWRGLWVMVTMQIVAHDGYVRCRSCGHDFHGSVDADDIVRMVEL